ncbi:hypothetical protein J7K19_06890, partial [bacterium]|nr:hypothetical protein [bacterium]
GGTAEALFAKYGPVLIQWGIQNVNQLRIAIATFGLPRLVSMLDRVMLRGRRVFDVTVYQYMINSYTVNDVTISFVAGKGWVDYTPGTPWGWCSYYVGVTIPFP